MKCTTVVRLVGEKISGICPERLFCESKSVYKSGRHLNDDGMFPFKKLCAKFRSTSPSKLPILSMSDYLITAIRRSMMELP